MEYCIRAHLRVVVLQAVEGFAGDGQQPAPLVACHGVEDARSVAEELGGADHAAAGVYEAPAEQLRSNLQPQHHCPRLVSPCLCISLCGECILMRCKAVMLS